MKLQYEIFSIESRKGGVGKTTMALNLSKSLLDKGYKVLFIDCDISGTPISNAVNKSVFWKNFINTEINDEGHYLNLMELFISGYRSQQINAKGIVQSLHYQSDKINIISSDIYGDDGSLLIDPRHLMDEMNSFWLLGLLKEIASEFTEIDDKRTAIVIDNSPGYVGLGRCVREWLTSLGPKYAHFLLVSSLDIQDVEASISSAEEIYRIMDAKLKLANADEYPELNVDIEELIAADSSLGQFYYSLSDEHPFKESNQRENCIGEYVCLVFNKVPESLMDGSVSYKLPQANSTLREYLYNELIPLDDKGFPSKIIGYDSTFSEQFISPSIAVVGSGKKNWKEKINERYEFAFSQYDVEDKVRVAKSLGKSYSSLVKTLKKEGFKALSKAFNQQASPEWCLKDLVSKTKDVTNYVVFDKNVLNEDSIDYIQARNYDYLEELINRKGLARYSAILHSLVDEIHQKTTSNKKQRTNPRYLANVSVLLRMFFMVVDCEYNEEVEFYDYVVSEYNTKDNVNRNWHGYMPEEYFTLYDEIKAITSGFEGMLKNTFSDFYRSFIYAFIKMHDSIDDYILLLNAFQYTIQSDSPRLINKYMKDYITRVVIGKSMRFDKNEFKSIVEKPMEMRVVQDLINEKVLKQWR